MQQMWLHMLACQQELHRFSRAMLAQGQKQTLTASELELLSLLYRKDEESTPLALSRQSGMKKEAVSRSLKQLYAKGLIEKERSPQDERSYVLSLTERGRSALRDNYGLLLQPLYDLQRAMGEDFDRLFGLIAEANDRMEQARK